MSLREEEEELTDEDESARRGVSPSPRRRAAPTRLFNSLPSSPHFWNTIIIVALLAAILCLLTGHTDATFVLATLGVVAWFFQLRNRLRADDVITGETVERGDVDEENRDEDE
jgi:hypothetical protein